MRLVSAAIARLGACIAKGALKDFIKLAANLLRRNWLADNMSKSSQGQGKTLKGGGLLLAGPWRTRWLWREWERNKVMTNKRIHVSAIVLLIAAIIIDMNNNGLCPLSFILRRPSSSVCVCVCVGCPPFSYTTGSFMVRGTWQPASTRSTTGQYRQYP